MPEDQESLKRFVFKQGHPPPDEDFIWVGGFNSKPLRKKVFKGSK